MQGGSDGNNLTSGIGQSIQLYREVHKHAYLRHINTQHGKKSSGEQYWVVFCVHCDTVPYLEFYSTQATSVTHQPIWRMCLTGTTSVSGALVPQGKLYRLTLVTRESGITLAASTWDDMKDWVDTLRAKLREMKILGPGENLYSKPPEQLVRNRAPTRDPTSPLPPPPPGPVVYVPGTEIPARSQQNDENQLRSNETVSSSNILSTECIPSNENISSNEIINRNVDNSSSPSNMLSYGENLRNDPNISHNNVIIEPSTSSGIQNVNRFHVMGTSNMNNDESTSTISNNNNVSIVNTPYEQLKITTDNNKKVKISNKSHENITKITSENVSKMKDFTKEATTKVCKDGGLILYNKSLEVEDQPSFVSNPEQWDDLNTTLNDNLNNVSSNISMPSSSSNSNSNRVAKISGMNVCLVDKLIPSNRNNALNSSDDDFDTNDFIDSQKDIVQIKRDSKGYTQVDINSKKVELFKHKWQLPTSLLNGPSTMTNHNSEDLVTIDNSNITNKQKPIPKPRTKLDINNKTDNKQGGVYVSLTECNTNTDNSMANISLRDQTDRKKVSLNRTSSVPDSIESEHILDTFCGVMVDESSNDNKTMKSPSSNVTIISVRNSEASNTVPSTAIPIVGTSFNFDLVNQFDNMKSTNVSITNIDSTTFTTPTVDDNNCVEVRQKNDSVGSDGHVRNSSSKKRSSLDNNCEKISNRQNNVMKISKALQIPEFKQFKNISHDARSTSTNNTRDFYESVFGPFNNDNAQTTSSSDKIIVQVPKLIVNIPNSPQIQRKRQLGNCRNELFGETSNSVGDKNVFVKSRQLIDINKDDNKIIVNTTSPQYRSNNTVTQSNNTVTQSNNTVTQSNNTVTQLNNTTTQPNHESEYEFLSWNATNNPQNRDTNQQQMNDNEIRIENSANNQQQDADNSQTKQRVGLFTRGLTDLNIVTKFKNLSTKPTKNSNFYDDNNTPNNSSSNDTPSCSNNIKKNSPFTAKLNNIFNKFTTDNNTKSVVTIKNRNVENIVRTETSLRRNWSEHNDRTQPNINIRHNSDNKPLRPRPPVIGGLSPRRQLVTNQCNDSDNRRRSNSLSDARTASGETNTSQTNTATPTTITTAPKPILNVPMMSLREQQVMRLRNEMGHSGGIRLLLSSRDSPELAVALVDIYSGVWVAGWKQRSHPLLYNALHIGDRLHSVDGCIVSNARQARRAIQNNNGPKVEIIIKRLPHGRVYALKRDSDRLDLGLIMDCANITGIVPNSPAHRAGVPNIGTLTEVNGRPLNLLLKKGSTQVKDRLTSVGKEVSILVQPTEFVSLLRAALKAVRGYKEYIVQ